MLKERQIKFIIQIHIHEIQIQRLRKKQKTIKYQMRLYKIGASRYRCRQTFF